MGGCPYAHERPHPLCLLRTLSHDNEAEMADEPWSAESKDRWWTIALVAFTIGLLFGAAMTGAAAYWAIKWATAGS